MEDLYAAGGIPAIMRELDRGGLIDRDAPTVTGKTMGEIADAAPAADGRIIHALEDPYYPEGGLRVLRGNLAPDGAVVKQSAVPPEMRVHTGPARVFDSEEDAVEAILGGRIVAGDVVVIRYEGPKGGPGMREMLTPTLAISGMGLWRRAARSSPTAASPAPPRARRSATSRRKPRPAARSRSSTRATRSPSTSTRRRSRSTSTTPSWRRAAPRWFLGSPRSRPACSHATHDSSQRRQGGGAVMSDRITGAEALVRCLEAEGVEVLFGYPGGVALPIFDALYRLGEDPHDPAAPRAGRGAHGRRLRAGDRAHAASRSPRAGRARPTRSPASRTRAWTRSRSWCSPHRSPPRSSAPTRSRSPTSPGSRSRSRSTTTWSRTPPSCPRSSRRRSTSPPPGGRGRCSSTSRST